MEGKGGCCVTRYATAAAYDMSKVERIMLRYRPIAPKPLAAAAAAASSSESGAAFSRSAGGAKRKYVKDENSTNRRRRKTAAPPPPPAVTLPLLPESPDPKDPPPEEKRDAAAASKAVDLTAAGTVVTVECVTDTWREEEEEEGSTEKLMEDTCPGFISDGYGRVTWTNGAFRGMVGYGGEVWLVGKVGVGVPYKSGFTCRVRVQQREKGTDLTVPCDVWRVMDGGGFAWRLDVKSALTLRLGL